MACCWAEIFEPKTAATAAGTSAPDKPLPPEDPPYPYLRKLNEQFVVWSWFSPTWENNHQHYQHISPPGSSRIRTVQALKVGAMDGHTSCWECHKGLVWFGTLQDKGPTLPNPQAKVKAKLKWKSTTRAASKSASRVGPGILPWVNNVNKDAHS